MFACGNKKVSSIGMKLFIRSKKIKEHVYIVLDKAFNFIMP